MRKAIGYGVSRLAGGRQQIDFADGSSVPVGTRPGSTRDGFRLQSTRQRRESMRPKIFRLFLKPWCPWCIEAREWLDARGFEYEPFDVTSDADAKTEMVALTGQSKAPSAEIDGHVLADFGAAELELFLKKHGYSV
jgi:glutaredoxin 3